MVDLVRSVFEAPDHGNTLTIVHSMMAFVIEPLTLLKNKKPRGGASSKNVLQNLGVCHLSKQCCEGWGYRMVYDMMS